MAPLTRIHRPRGARSARSPLVSDYYRRSVPVIRARTSTITCMYLDKGFEYSAERRVAGVRFNSHPARYYIHNFRIKHSPVLGPRIRRLKLVPGCVSSIQNFKASPRGHLAVTIAGFQVDRSSYEVIHSDFLADDEIHCPFPRRRLCALEGIINIRSPTVLSDAGSTGHIHPKDAPKVAAAPEKSKHKRTFSLSNLLSAGVSTPKTQHKRSHTTSQFTARVPSVPAARVEVEKKGLRSKLKRWFGRKQKVAEPTEEKVAGVCVPLADVPLGGGLLDEIQAARPDLLS